MIFYLSPLKRVKAADSAPSRKGDTLMKRTSAIALLALSCMGAAAQAIAQEPALKANVPFQFNIAGKLLPADRYTITSPAPGIVMIQSADLHRTVMTAVSHGNDQPAQGSKLIFERYGDQYFLHQVRCSTSSDINSTIPTSKLEKEVRLQAKNGEGEPVLVAAR